MILYREFVMRKHLGMNTWDYREVLTEDVTRFMDWHEDEDVKDKLDLFGSQGTDLTDPKFNDDNGFNFYRDWMDRKKARADRYQVKEVVDKKAIERMSHMFDEVVGRIIGERKITEFQQKFQGEGRENGG